MSVGNATQVIDLDSPDLTLVLGDNLDLGSDGSRNGTGKTTIINALSYALFGSAISNIRKDNLINRTNAKNMMVSLDFSIGTQQYRIERGRKPNVLKFYINSEATQCNDESQGDSRETQDAIEQVLGLSHDMFRHVVALNTYTEPFLSLRANDQRIIIEQLLGITQLSERAEQIKELNRVTKDQIVQEEHRIRAVTDSNARIQDQIQALQRRQSLWLDKQRQDCAALLQACQDLEHIQIDQEVQAHRDLDAYLTKKKNITQLTKYIAQIDADDARLNLLLANLKTEIAALDAHTCHTCGHHLHDSQQQALKEARQALLEDCALQLLTNSTQRLEYQDELQRLGDPGQAPEVFYPDLEQALNHKNTLEGLVRDLGLRQAETDPYGEQITDMQSQALQTVSYDKLNELTRLQEHQDFLLKLLTSKDSFVRKKIIDQNLSYLNSRLTHYLSHMGLPHQVEFRNDLSVEISELGRDLDFDNLSRGERNRLILALSWAFRDIWESLYQPINLLFVDELIDSGLDTSGVESALALLKQMSRERNKSVWLVSHRDELIGRVEHILKVVKENGFTSYSTDLDVPL